MIIDDFYVFRPGCGPAEANAELIVHANAMLTRTVALQGFESVAGRHSKVVEPIGDLQLPKLPSRYVFDLLESSDPASADECFSISVLER